MTIFQVKLLTRTYCDKAEDYAVPNGFLIHWTLLSDLTFGQKLYPHKTGVRGRLLSRPNIQPFLSKGIKCEISVK